MDAAIQAIGTVGFPIVFCLIIAWYVYYTGNKHSEELKTMTAQHAEEINAIKDAITTMTVEITRLAGEIAKMTGGRQNE